MSTDRVQALACFLSPEKASRLLLLGCVINQDSLMSWGSLLSRVLFKSLMNTFSAIMQIRFILVFNPNHQMATGKNRINWSGYSSFISFCMRKNQ